MAAARKWIEADSTGGARERGLHQEATLVAVNDRRHKMRVVVAGAPEEIAGHAQAWASLAAAAIEPNAFYEPWMLIPAVKHLAGNDELHFVFIYATDSAKPTERPLLCGFFPLQRSRRAMGLVNSLRLWKHIHCFLCTPLLRRGRAEECLEALFDWLAEAPFGCSIIEFGSVAGDGPFHRLLVDYLFNRGSVDFVSEQHTRALFRRSETADAFMRSSLNTARRKELRRKTNRLADGGQLEWTSLEENGDLETWIAEFLELEAAGWKGRAGGAINCSKSQREFFAEICEAAHRQGSLRAIGLRINGRPIAQRWCFVSGEGSFAFKTAFDERFSRQSPGVLLQVEQARRLHSDPAIQWMDSCAASDSHLNHLWRDRRIIETVVAGNGGPLGDFIVSMMPLLRWAFRTARLRRARRDRKEPG